MRVRCSHSTSTKRPRWFASCACISIVLLLLPGCSQQTPATRTWPDSAWHPYHPTDSPFNWNLPNNPPLLPSSANTIALLVSKTSSGCDPADQTAQLKCKPTNLVAANDGLSGGGWATYYPQATDPEITVNCTSGPCPLPPGFKLRMPAGARVQVGSPDRHLTIVDRDGNSGLKKPNYEYDFYQVQSDTIPSSGSIDAKSEGSLSLNSIGQSETIGSITGNTNAAGFGNLAGRIRIEELAAGSINHAVSIAVPCTKNEYMWPANHKAVPSYCNALGALDWPAMGQLLWLDLDSAGIEANPTSKNAPQWAKTILRAMHDHGAYVNDNGGYLNGFFQLQTEAQSQYTSLNSGDPWLSFAQSNWTPGSSNDFVGFLQGTAPPPGNQRTAFFTDWQNFWHQHLHVVNTCSLPGAGCIN
jgi:hypothetical protein